MEYHPHQPSINISCCDQPLRVNAPVDWEFSESGIRFRHIPGNICLSCRDIYIPEVTAGASLSRSITDCINGDPSGLIILKTRRRKADAGETMATDGFSPAYLDIGLGANAGLVVENIKGYRNRASYEVILPGEGEELRSRLLQLDHLTDGRLIPSLVYDTPQHPGSVQIELTTRCNLTCAYCTNKDLEVRDDITPERLESLLEQVDFSKMSNVDVTGLGEPLMNKQLPAIIRQIKLRGYEGSIRVVTNGTVLPQSAIEELCDAGITSIAFSIDSMNRERFAKSRGGAKLQKVLENLEALVAYRNEHSLNHLEIKIKAVLIDDPYSEAEDLMQYSSKLNIEMPHFSCLDSRNTVREHYKEQWLKDDWSADSSPEFLSWAQNRWNELTAGIKTTPFILSSIAGDAADFLNPVLNHNHLCRWAIDAAFISSTGDMLSCCEQMIDLPRHYRGSLMQKNLYQLWQDDLLWSYRLPLSAGVSPRACSGCIWAPVATL